MLEKIQDNLQRGGEESPGRRAVVDLFFLLDCVTTEVASSRNGLRVRMLIGQWGYRADAAGSGQDTRYDSSQNRSGCVATAENVECECVTGGRDVVIS
jgi:hypothetical protein